jgi:hypothetical protein
MHGGDGIHLHAAGRGSTIADVVIRGNTFTDLDFPVELVHDNGSDNRIAGVQILNNDFSLSSQAINLLALSGRPLTNNLIENTLIAANTFRSNATDIAIYAALFPGASGNAIVNTQIVGNTFTGAGFAIAAHGGAEGASGNTIRGLRIANNVIRGISTHALSFTGGGENSSDNVIEEVQIVNNLVAGVGSTAIALAGGTGTSSRNRVRNVRVTNNTVVNATANGVWAIGNLAAATGNEVSDVLVANSLMWRNRNDFVGLEPGQVSNSLTTYQNFAGANGNVGGDPLFLDSSNGDYHLRPSSPAIAAGNAAVAPYEDLECRARNGTPSIGAYAFGGSGADCSVAGRNFTSLWWDPRESGWGLNLNHQGTILFGTLFTYAADGRPMWLVASNLALQADGSYRGPLYRTTGPAFNRVPWTDVNVSTVGAMTVRPGTASMLGLTYSVNGTSVSRIVQRQVFGSPVPTCVAISASRSGASNFQDLWWNPAESGWGLNLTHQGALIFATLFTYDTNGRDLWLVASALARQPDGSYSGSLYSTQGPSFDSRQWTSASATAAGSMRLVFAAGDRATLEYDYAGARVTKQITRQLFAPTAPSCQ